MDQPLENTDREIWREVEGDFYSPSIHVTETGSIGISVAGTVTVKPIREWDRLARELDNLKIRLNHYAKAIERRDEELEDLNDTVYHLKQLLKKSL